MQKNRVQFIAIALLMLGLAAPFKLATSTAEATIVARKCRCGKASCRECRPGKVRKGRLRGCQRCPKCQTDVCELKAECVKEKRLCFEVEQKVICIPKISWPWNRCKCANANCHSDCECLCRCKYRCGKTKTVNVLKASFCECPNCKYTWKVFEPELPKAIDPDKPYDAEPVAPDVQQPQFERNELYDPGGADVPTPPATNRINN